MGGRDIIDDLQDLHVGFVDVWVSKNETSGLWDIGRDEIIISGPHGTAINAFEDIDAEFEKPDSQEGFLHAVDRITDEIDSDHVILRVPVEYESPWYEDHGEIPVLIDAGGHWLDFDQAKIAPKYEGGFDKTVFLRAIKEIERLRGEVPPERMPYAFLNGPWENATLPTIVQENPKGGDPHILATLKSVHNPDALYELCHLANVAASIPDPAATMKEVREVISELVDLMDGVISGDYKPDSFTCQPARALLAKMEGK